MLQKSYDENKRPKIFHLKEFGHHGEELVLVDGQDVDLRGPFANQQPLVGPREGVGQHLQLATGLSPNGILKMR